MPTLLNIVFSDPTTRPTIEETAAFWALHGNAFNPDTGQPAEYPELSKCSIGHEWQRANAKEIGRLAQGHKETEGTDTIFFIKREQVPKERTATYVKMVSAYRPEKDDPYRVRWTAGGDRVNYEGKVSPQAAYAFPPALSPSSHARD